MNSKALLFPAKYILNPCAALTSKLYIALSLAEPAIRLVITLFCPAELVGLYTYNAVFPVSGFPAVEVCVICNLLVGLVVQIPTLPLFAILIFSNGVPSAVKNA